jgi:hypothetical protein
MARLSHRAAAAGHCQPAPLRLAKHGICQRMPRDGLRCSTCVQCDEGRCYDYR